LTGSLFPNNLVTYLEVSQSVVNGIFLGGAAIPQTNTCITAYSASVLLEINSLYLPNNQCPTWGQLYAARPTLSNVTVVPTYAAAGGYKQYLITVSTNGSIAVDTNVTSLISYSYNNINGDYVSSNLVLTIPSGSYYTSSYVSPLYSKPSVNITYLSPLSSIDQKYLIGNPQS